MTMTLERAQQLVIEHGCRFIPRETSLVVINETLNFKFTMSVDHLPNVSEEAFISTITTGRPPRGQRALLGVYQDAFPSDVGAHVYITLADLLEMDAHATVSFLPKSNDSSSDCNH